MLLKELSLSQSCSDLEQAVHLVRLLTTSVTDNGKCSHYFNISWYIYIHTCVDVNLFPLLLYDTEFGEIHFDDLIYPNNNFDECFCHTAFSLFN